MTSERVVRWSCEDCRLWWATPSEYEAHKSTCGESDKIVREYAQRGPFTDHESYRSCADCGYSPFEGGGGSMAEMNTPANHEPSCLWRRSRELYPNREPAP